jgi:sarcosine oxidase
MRTLDLIVVGAGVMGCATAYQAAREGRRVLLLEQYRIGHARGSSHGPSRIIRLAYTSVNYVRLCQAAYHAWRDVESEVGKRLLATAGGLDFAESDTPSLEKTRSSLHEAGVLFDELGRADIVARFPQFKLPNDTVGIYQRDTAILAADLCVAALAFLAKHHGAEIVEETKVEGVEPGADGVVVHAGGRRFDASRAVLAVGSWLGPLASDLGLDLPLRVTKEQVAYFTPREPRDFAVGQFPVMIEHNKHAPFRSGFPIFRSECVKLMIESRVASADETGEVDQSRLEQLKHYAKTLLPGLGEMVKAETCRYTITPDEDFILDRHPEHPQIVLASPCSGHGFKFGALFGRILVDLAFERASRHDIRTFQLNRPGLLTRIA